jgi:predicted dehydrogenase
LAPQIKLAILGGSNNSAVGRAHVAAIKMADKFSIVAGCFSRDPEVNLNSGRDYGIQDSNIFDSVQSLIDYCKENKLVVLVCTPTDLHTEHVLMCLDAGLKVIVEKAMSTSVNEALKIVELTQGNSELVSVIYNYTSYPAVRYLKNAFRSGIIGNPLKMNISMPQESFIKKDADRNPLVTQAWRLRDGAIPTISLDLGVHLHSLVKFISGLKALSVIAITSNKGNFKNIIDDVQCIVQYEQNLEVNFWYSKIALGHRNGMKIEIYGTEGSLIWEQEMPEKIKHSNVFGQISVIDRGSPDNFHGNDGKYNYFKPGHPTGFIEALSNYYLDIYDMLTKDDPVEPFDKKVFGATDALEGLKFLEAVHLSAKVRKWIDLD